MMYLLQVTFLIAWINSEVRFVTLKGIKKITMDQYDNIYKKIIAETRNQGEKWYQIYLSGKEKEMKKTANLNFSFHIKKNDENNINQAITPTAITSFLTPVSEQRTYQTKLTDFSSNNRMEFANQTSQQFSQKKTNSTSSLHMGTANKVNKVNLSSRPSSPFKNFSSIQQLVTLLQRKVLQQQRASLNQIIYIRNSPTKGSQDNYTQIEQKYSGQFSLPNALQLEYNVNQFKEKLIIKTLFMYFDNMKQYWLRRRNIKMSRNNVLALRKNKYLSKAFPLLKNYAIKHKKRRLQLIQVKYFSELKLMRQYFSAFIQFHYHQLQKNNKIHINSILLQKMNKQKKLFKFWENWANIKKFRIKADLKNIPKIQYYSTYLYFQKYRKAFRQQIWQKTILRVIKLKYLNKFIKKLKVFDLFIQGKQLEYLIDNQVFITTKIKGNTCFSKKFDEWLKKTKTSFQTAFISLVESNLTHFHFHEIKSSKLEIKIIVRSGSNFSKKRSVQRQLFGKYLAGPFFCWYNFRKQHFYSNAVKRNLDKLRIIKLYQNVFKTLGQYKSKKIMQKLKEQQCIPAIKNILKIKYFRRWNSTLKSQMKIQNFCNQFEKLSIKIFFKNMKLIKLADYQRKKYMGEGRIFYLLKFTFNQLVKYRMKKRKNRVLLQLIEKRSVYNHKKQCFKKMKKIFVFEQNLAYLTAYTILQIKKKLLAKYFQGFRYLLQQKKRRTMSNGQMNQLKLKQCFDIWKKFICKQQAIRIFKEIMLNLQRNQKNKVFNLLYQNKQISLAKQFHSQQLISKIFKVWFHSSHQSSGIQHFVELLNQFRLQHLKKQFKSLREFVKAQQTIRRSESNLKYKVLKAWEKVTHAYDKMKICAAIQKSNIESNIKYGLEALQENVQEYQLKKSFRLRKLSKLFSLWRQKSSQLIALQMLQKNNIITFGEMNFKKQFFMALKIMGDKNHFINRLVILCKTNQEKNLKYGLEAIQSTNKECQIEVFSKKKNLASTLQFWRQQYKEVITLKKLIKINEIITRRTIAQQQILFIILQKQHKINKLVIQLKVKYDQSLQTGFRAVQDNLREYKLQTSYQTKKLSVLFRYWRSQSQLAITLRRWREMHLKRKILTILQKVAHQRYLMNHFFSILTQNYNENCFYCLQAIQQNNKEFQLQKFKRTKQLRNTILLWRNNAKRSVQLKKFSKLSEIIENAKINLVGNFFLNWKKQYLLIHLQNLLKLSQKNNFQAGLKVFQINSKQIQLKNSLRSKHLTRIFSFWKNNVKKIKGLKQLAKINYIRHFEYYFFIELKKLSQMHKISQLLKQIEYKQLLSGLRAFYQNQKELQLSVYIREKTIQRIFSLWRCEFKRKQALQKAVTVISKSFQQYRQTIFIKFMILMKQSKIIGLTQKNLQRQTLQIWSNKFQRNQKLLRLRDLLEIKVIRTFGYEFLKQLRLEKKLQRKGESESRYSLIYSVFKAWKMVVEERRMLKKYLSQCTAEEKRGKSLPKNIHC